jgi:hypothetical protein
MADSDLTKEGKVEVLDSEAVEVDDWEDLVVEGSLVDVGFEEDN